MNALPRQPMRPEEPETSWPGFSIRDVRYDACLNQPRHHHERTTATLILDGSLEEVVGSAHERARPSSAVFKPAGTEHANRIGPDGALTLQLSFESDFLETSDAAVQPSQWGWAHGGPVAGRFIGLFGAWRAGPEDEADLEGRVYDLLSGLWDLGASTAGRGRSGADAPAWLHTVVEEVEDTFPSPRRVRDLAADAGVHPVALARAHRRYFGASLSDRVRARRVGAAATLLRRPEMSLTRIAYETGFSDQSHLTRVFKAETGFTPGRYRRLLQT